MVDLYASLNPQQREAVVAEPGPILVLAGPGSGKTRVLTHRIAHLIHEHNVAPWHIAAVTFTNKAAGEMRERLERLIADKARGLRIGTFHALCARILRTEAEKDFLPGYNKHYLIYDTSDQRALLKRAIEEIGVNLKRLNLTDYKLLSRISDAKNELVTPAQFPRAAYEDEVIARVYEHYQTLLRTSNAMDFDDLIMQTVLLFRREPDVRARYQEQFQHVLVDEFQDTNMAQYELVRLWAAPQNQVLVVGDEDQAIYGFRGADYRNVMRFRKDYHNAKTILLEQNYRSTQIILDAARAVIDHNRDRTPKKLFTERTDAIKIYAYEAFDEREEAEFIAKEITRLQRSGYTLPEIAVMYRTNVQSRGLEQTLVDNRIPYQLIGGVAFYQRREIKDLLAYLRLIDSGADSVSFDRVINVPKRGIGAKTQATFEKWADEQGVPYGDALIQLAHSGAEGAGFGVATTRKLAQFGEHLTAWRGMAAQGQYVALLEHIIDSTGYLGHLTEISKDDEEVLERQANIEELKGLLAKADFETLADFLTDTALSSDVDTTTDKDRVLLLTLHASKGLEYRAVFITGLEDGILPHSRSLDSLDGVEEERRLLYVGITRAKERLYITRAFRRRLGQYSEEQTPSRFLYDLPPELLEGAGNATTMKQQQRRYERSVTWDTPDVFQMQQPIARRAPKSDPDGKIITFPNAKPAAFKTGMRVRHHKFGEGVVIESKTHDSDEEVTVAFEEVGIKRLMASFANLETLPG